MRSEQRAEILTAKGFTESDVDPVMAMVVDQLIEARLIAQSYFEFLAASGGPISTKGRQRRCVEGFMRASDRVAKFAQMIGLERQARRIQQTPVEWLESLEPNEQQEEAHNDEHAPISDETDAVETQHSDEQ